LAGVPLLAPLSSTERSKIAEALDELRFRPGECVVKQHEQDDSNQQDAMFVIITGTAEVEKRQKDGSITQIRRLAVGDSFGERSLITNEPRSATVKALTTVEVLRLDRTAFFLLLGPLEDILHKRVSLYEHRDQQAEAGHVEFERIDLPGNAGTDIQATIKNKEEAPAPERPPNNALKGRVIQMENLQVVATLGKGSFGRVHLVTDKNSGEAYALKIVNKSILSKPKHQAHILSEKEMLVKVNSPWVISLFATFKDHARLYFLLECCLGGELFALLRAHTCFENNVARYYVAAVVLGFEYMHSINIVYRDLKPENVMLDSAGYPKVVDLGFATALDDKGRTYTLCGTPAYLSPEIIAGKGYGKGVDWWCLGVFIFELVCGYPPFRSTKHRGNMLKLYERIRAGKYQCPSIMTPEAVEIVDGFLKPKPHERLGVTHGGEKRIKEHKWFADFSWSALVNKTMRAPIIPYVADNADAANFQVRDDGSQPIFSSKPYVSKGWDRDF
jgi:hypothetical protein